MLAQAASALDFLNGPFHMIQGLTVEEVIARVPADTEVLYHVMVGPGVLTFVKEMGEHFGKKRPQIFGFIDSLVTHEAAPLREILSDYSKANPAVRLNMMIGSESEIDRAVEILIDWKRNLAKFESEQYKHGIASGEFLIVRCTRDE